MLVLKSTAARAWPLLLLPLVALPAPAQLLPRPSVPSTVTPLSFDDIFAGLNAPLIYKVSELKGEWRLAKIKARPELESAPIVVAPRPDDKILTSERLREAIGAGDGQYVTQGQTVAAGGELFLIAYKMKFDDDEMQAALQADAQKLNRPVPLPLAEMATWMENYIRERPMHLVLLNVKMLGEMSSIRPFDAATQIAALRGLIREVLPPAEAPPLMTGPGANGGQGTRTTPLPTLGGGRTAPGTTTGTMTGTAPSGSAPALGGSLPPAPVASLTKQPKSPLPTLAQRHAASQKNLHLIGLALLAYVQDHRGVLPAMHTPDEARKVLTFYAGSDAVWVRPDNGQAYLPNPIASGRKTAHISNPEEFVAFYEANPASDGTRGVVFLNGETARIPANDWARAKKASKLK